MSAHPLLDEILRLPAEQRLQLVADVWDSLAGSPADVPVPEWHRELLDGRLADPGERAERMWEEVRAHAVDGAAARRARVVGGPAGGP